MTAPDIAAMASAIADDWIARVPIQDRTRAATIAARLRLGLAVGDDDVQWLRGAYAARRAETQRLANLYRGPSATVIRLRAVGDDMRATG